MHRFEERLPWVGVMLDCGFVSVRFIWMSLCEGFEVLAGFLLKVRQSPLFGLHGNGHLQVKQEDLVFRTLATEYNAGKASATIDGLEDSLST